MTEIRVRVHARVNVNIEEEYEDILSKEQKRKIAKNLAGSKCSDFDQVDVLAESVG